MGGVCIKPSVVSPCDKRSSKLSSESRVTQSKRLNSSTRVRGDRVDNNSSIKPIPKAIEGELVVAGWPSWLAEVAGEAINGWLPRRTDTFEKLDKIGQGTYSSVYKARDLTNGKIVALKRVRFDSKDSESVTFMAREIAILRRLDHPNVIKLEGLIASRTSCALYLVFEYMEHDLTGLVTLPGVKFTEPQVKCYMRQLLNGLDHCHSRGVLHRDIKASNLLIDNNGILKIADFGLANFFSYGQTVALTSRVVTLWYRPLELLLGATHYGVGVDLWSAGCILGELYAGKPIMPGLTEVEQLHKIYKLCGSPCDSYWVKLKLPNSTVFKPVQPYKRRIVETFKDFPPAAIGLMDALLAIDPEQRGTAALALKSEFFTTKPHACDPSSLPKYPPNKEIDTKIREIEAKRQREAKESSRVPTHHVNTESVKSTHLPMEQSTIIKDSKNDVKHSPSLMSSYSRPLAASARGVGVISTSSKSSKYKDLPSQPTKHLNSPENMDGEGNKIQFSGPLVSSNVDQMLKDHEKRIQQTARRLRLERIKLIESP